MTTPGAVRDDALLAHRATGLLATFNAGGVLDLADVHTAQAVSRIAGESDPSVALAVALCVRALRNGSVCLDLSQARNASYDQGETEIDIAGLPWPETGDWLAAVERSPMVRVGPTGPDDRPLRLVGGLLYLQRYWRQEEQVRVELGRRFAADPPPIDQERLAAALIRLFPGSPGGRPDLQRLATAVGALSWVTVLAGGPGTGKTTTVARMIAALADQADPTRGDPPPRIALAAPTGKAAARLQEAVRTAAAELAEEDRRRIGEIGASTLHRLLGWLPGNRSRFRHDANNHLPHDVVIVDELSMVSLTMMARLLEAVRPTARLILVGDPDQLSSVEAGAVLADIARAPGRPDSRLGVDLAELGLLGPEQPPPTHGVVELTHTWRYGGAIGELARAIRADDADGAIAVLRAGGDGVRFTELEVDGLADPLQSPALSLLSQQIVAAGRHTWGSAVAGDAHGALRGLDEHRLLCAHRTGPYGVHRWSIEIERQLTAAIPGYAEDGEWYLGRPLLVTANDYEMGLYNGDTGVIVATADGPRAAFLRGAPPEESDARTEPVRLYPPVRLDAIQTVHAMTVHRAQGSQFDAVTFVLPPLDSPLLTRELLYTAISRARSAVHLIGSEEAVRLAVARPASRASGLSHRLGGQPDR